MSKGKSPSWKRSQAAINAWARRKADRVHGLRKEIEELYQDLERLYTTIAINGPSLRRLGYSIHQDHASRIIEYTQEVLQDARTLKKLIPRLQRFVAKAEELRKLVRPPRERWP